MDNELDEFGKLFIENVRDRSIYDIDCCISGKYKSARARELSSSYSQLTSEDKEFVDFLITEVIDNCLHNMLDMFEQNKDLKITLNDKNLVDESDGLAGELYSEFGWIYKYSKERNSNN